MNEATFHANLLGRFLGPKTRAWYGMEDRMEQKFRYGIWKMPEWNGMEDFKNEMEDNLPYFQINFTLDFDHGILQKKYIWIMITKNMWKRLSATHMSTN